MCVESTLVAKLVADVSPEKQGHAFPNWGELTVTSFSSAALARATYTTGFRLQQKSRWCPLWWMRAEVKRRFGAGMSDIPSGGFGEDWVLRLRPLVPGRLVGIGSMPVGLYPFYPAELLNEKLVG